MKSQNIFFIALVLKFTIGCFFSIAQPISQVDETESKTRWLEKFLQTPLSISGNMYDVKHYVLDLTLNPNVNAISGTVFIGIQITNTTSFLTFDLRDNMVISEIRWNDQPVTFTRLNHVVTVNVGTTLSPPTLGTLEIRYSGTPVTQGFGAWAQTTHNGAGIIWTLSEPYGAYTWWPCKNNLTDKADSIDIIIRTTPGNKAASNGILHGVTYDANQVTYHWKHRHPIAVYLVAIAVTNYVELTRTVTLHTGETVLIVDYCYPESQNEWQSNGTNVNNAMVFFSQQFIPYPFRNEKYGHAQFGWGGGMEHQTMSFMYNLGEMLVVHELSHQWFGNYITCGSWSDIWLNESFARYCEGLYTETFYPAQFKSWRMTRISNITSAPDGSVYVYDTTSINTIFNSRLVYDKGAMVLHMLRKQIGDSVFFAAIKNYLTNPNLINNFARTPQLKAHFEQAADTNLVDFFNDWIYNQGYPSYNIVWQYAAPYVYLRVNQTQSHTSVSFFEMKIPIKISRPNSDTTVWLHNIHNNQLFLIQTQFVPTSVMFDPDYHLITRYNSVTQGQLVSIEELNSQSVKVHPNPTSHQKIILSSEKILREILLYSLSGKLIFQMQPNQHKVEITVPQGIYLLKIYEEFGKTTVIRIVSQ